MVFVLGTGNYTSIAVLTAIDVFFSIWFTTLITDYINCGLTAIDGFFVVFNCN
jgi:hypothetical protein